MALNELPEAASIDRESASEPSSADVTATLTSGSNDSLSQQPISNRARKKAERKRLKKIRKQEFVENLMVQQQKRIFRVDSVSNNNNNNNSTEAAPPSFGGGKASRARAARKGIEVPVGSCYSHRPSGGAPVLKASEDEFHEVTQALERLETAARIRCRPELVVRKQVPMDNHGSMVEETVEKKRGGDVREKKDPIVGECTSLIEANLRSFSLSLIPEVHHPLSSLTVLDLSRNELWTLPDDLSCLSNLQILDLSRNWLADIPPSIAHLTNLQCLRASHNMLKASQQSLQVDVLKSLAHLREFDITFNRLCGRQSLADMLTNALPTTVSLKITISYPPAPGSFVGASAAERDPTLLRSQLEPWSTTALRRRIVADFGLDVLSPEEYPRAQVMTRLLELYQQENAPRTVVRVQGTLVDSKLTEKLLVALRAWGDQWKSGNQERTSIHAENYMILSNLADGSRKAQKAALKLQTHATIWELAQQAIRSVDPDFAQKYTAVAVTHGFQGSPHIDRQNMGPFYGLAVGNFDEGTGEVMVECSSRVVAKVNTKNRLGKVDGRFPHWVARYDSNKERYSLIYYRTRGDIQPVGPAVFQVPTV